jgi:hypothetical protein
MSTEDRAADRQGEPFWKRHSLSLVAAGVLALWFVLYLPADPKSHAGSFFGNAIADWTGVVITILATGLGWAILFSRVDPESKWGTVVSNIVSEWSQQIGLVLLTKKLIEPGSKESADED